MPEPQSPHLPGVSGGVVAVTGEAIVDTGVREIQSFVAMLKESNVSPDEESIVSWYEFVESGSANAKVVIRVEKGGANHGTLGDTAVDVSWICVAKR